MASVMQVGFQLLEMPLMQQGSDVFMLNTTTLHWHLEAVFANCSQLGAFHLEQNTEVNADLAHEPLTLCIRNLSGRCLVSIVGTHPHHVAIVWPA